MDQSIRCALWKVGLFVILTSCQSAAQTYVGEVLYRNSYEYIKVTCKDNSCEFSVPYLDGNQKYPVLGLPFKDQRWEVQRGIEKWQFDTTIEEGKFSGNLSLPSGQQSVLLYRQNEGIPKEELSRFAGIYEDESQRRAIIYSRFDYLHLMSPYTEETLSLKPIGAATFWSVSGEQSQFSDFSEGNFQTLKISDRFGQQRLLKRVPPIAMEELWIPIGEDTLYAQLYLPPGSQKVPACLVLPGGGAIGLDNYIYEARFLASYGVASLVFDKPGNGQSKGANNFRLQTFEEKNEDYLALFKFLQNHPRVDAQKVGIHGPSEGGRLACLMAIDLKEQVAFVNAVAAPLMPFTEGQFYAMDQLHRNMGVDEIDNMEIQQIWREYYEGITKGQINAQTIERANLFRQKNERLFLPPNSTQIPGAPTRADILNDRVVAEADQITCPVLLQYGENDQRVNGPKSLQNFLPKMADKSKIHTLVYPRGEHSMMTPEYKICPGYMDDKIKWLRMIGILQP